MKSATRALFATLFFLIYLGAPAFATTYYVKTGGNDKAAGTSDATAWAHCPGLAGWSGSVTLQSGDTVYFRSQDTFTASSGDTILNATAGVTYDGGSYGSGTRAILRRTGNTISVVQIIASNVTLKSFEIDGNDYQANGIEVNYNNSKMDISNITIDNCLVHNIGSGDNYHYGIAVEPFGGRTVTNITITNCKVYNTVHEGITLYPSWQNSGNVITNAVIRGCEVYNTGTANAPFGAGIIIKDDVRGATIEFNYLHNNAQGIQFESYGGIPSPSNITIRYNIMKDNNNWGIYHLGGSYTSHIYGNLFINNGKSGYSNGGAILWESQSLSGSAFNVYNNTFFCATNGTSSPGCVYSAGSGSYSVNFENNVVYSNVSGVTPIRDVGNKFSHNNNLVFNAQGASAAHVNNGTNYNRAGVLTWEPSAQNTDPTFKNVSNLPTGFSGTYGTDMVPNNDGLSITSGAAIANGAILPNPYSGAINLSGTNLGITRAQDSGWDIGPYENNVQQTTLPPPQNLHIVAN